MSATITPLPTPPSRQDPANFATRADQFLAALPTFATEANNLSNEVNTKATAAANSATNAANSATAAANSATNAANSATAAANSATSAAASATAAANSFDAFDDRYLGAKASNPTTDNDGDALQVGALYWDTTANEMRVWNGSSWQVAVGALVGNADTATKLQTARTITIGNTGKAVDGSADVSWSLAEIGAARFGILANGVNLNSVINPGFYRLNEPYLNGPPFVAYGQLIVARGGGDTILQIVTGFNNGEIYWRQGNPPDVGGTGSWSPWHRFFHSGNINTANAGTATKLQTARTITIGNTGKAVDGSADVSWSLAEIGAAAATATVNLTGDQTIGGIKTFSSRVVSSAAVSGLFLSQDDNEAPFFATVSHSNSSYCPVIKIRGTGAANISTFSLGLLHNPNNTQDGVLHFIQAADVNSRAWFFRQTGDFVSPGNVTAFSDVRLKTDLEPIAQALDKVKALTGYTYTRIDTGERQTGLVAQDVQRVLPEAVIEGEHLSLAYGNLVGLLVEAIKEQARQIEALTARVKKLEGC